MGTFGGEHTRCHEHKGATLSCLVPGTARETTSHRGVPGIVDGFAPWWKLPILVLLRLMTRRAYLGDEAIRCVVPVANECLKKVKVGQYRPAAV